MDQKTQLQNLMKRSLGTEVVKVIDIGLQHKLFLDLRARIFDEDQSTRKQVLQRWAREKARVANPRLPRGLRSTEPEIQLPKWDNNLVTYITYGGAFWHGITFVTITRSDYERWKDDPIIQGKFGFHDIPIDKLEVSLGNNLESPDYDEDELTPECVHISYVRGVPPEISSTKGKRTIVWTTGADLFSIALGPNYKVVNKGESLLAGRTVSYIYHNVMKFKPWFDRLIANEALGEADDIVSSYNFWPPIFVEKRKR